MHVVFRQFYSKYKSFHEGGHEILEFPVRQRSFFPSETRCSTFRFHWGFPRTFLDTEAEGNNTLTNGFVRQLFYFWTTTGYSFGFSKKNGIHNHNIQELYNILKRTFMKILQINIKHAEQIFALKCSVHLLDYFLSFRVSSIYCICIGNKTQLVSDCNRELQSGSEKTSGNTHVLCHENGQNQSEY